MLVKTPHPMHVVNAEATVFVVDDDPEFRESVSLLLFRLGQEHFALKTTLFQEVTAPHPPQF